MFNLYFKNYIIGWGVMVLLLLQSNYAVARFSGGTDLVIKGLVLNDYGHPLRGVTVALKGGNITAVTGSEGTFQTTVPSGSTLVFRHPLFNVTELFINSNSNVTVRMSERYLPVTVTPALSFSKKQSDTEYLKSSADEEKIKVLYGEIQPESMLGSVSTVYSNQLSTTPASLYAYALPGRLAGLNVNQVSGFYTPLTNSLTSVDIFVGNIPNNTSGAGPTDNTEFSINLRGHAASLGQSPLTIIDGVQRELYSLDPESIESVSILKDALSTILLGQNSSRGALLVTTKQPQAGPPHLSFTAETGTQTSLGMPDPLPAYQYAYLLNEALLNDGKTPAYTASDFLAYKNGTDPYGHPNVNWYNTILKNNPLMTRLNLNVSGGGTLARYIVAMSYMDQQGMFKTSDANSYNTNADLKRYMINSKVDIDVNKYFSVSMQLFGRLQQGNQPGAGTSSILSTLLSTPNNAYPMYNPNGSYGGNANYTNNLLAMVESSGYKIDNSKDVMANLDLSYKLDRWLPGLWAKAKGNVSVQWANIIDRSKEVPVYNFAVSAAGDTTYNHFGSTVNQVNNFTTTSWARYWFTQLSLGYDHQFGKHTVGGTVLFDQKESLLNYDIPSFLTNWGAKGNYNYANKYFAEAAIDYGGYNRYAPGHQFGTFYAGGVGWNIARENFIKDNVKWLNQLKLRATYGKTGNANVDNYGYYIYRNYFSTVSGYAYDMGSTYPGSVGVMEQNGTLSNVNATWEKAHKLDVGLDISVFQNHLQLTADYYRERYYDVMQQPGKTIALMGMSYSAENIGIDRYFGEEFSVTYQNNIRNFNYFITANASVQQSKVIFMDEQYQKYSWNEQTGHPVGQRYGLIAEGLFQTAADAASSATIVGYTPHVGDIKYKDLNNDGVIDQFDIAPIGKERPIIYYGLTLGFNYKGLEFSALIQGIQNREIYVDNSYRDAGFQSQNNGYSQAYQQILGRWTPETAAYATYPRLTAGGSGYNYNPLYSSNSFFLKNGNYFRLKNINIGYSLPYNWIKRLKVGGIKFFVNAQNLFTWAAYDGVDPEVQLPNYPIQKVINAGINIKL